MVEGSVRDKQKAGEILSALRAVVRPGTVIRITNKRVVVDKSRCGLYNQVESDAGEGLDSKV